MSFHLIRFSSRILIVFTLCACTFTTVHAAVTNDLTLETTVILDVGGYSLTVVGNSATLASLVVNDTAFSVSLGDGASIEVSSAARVNLVHDASSPVVAETTCSATESRLALSTTYGLAVVTVTPSGTCTETSSGGSSSGSRPSSSVPTNPVVPTTPDTIPESPKTESASYTELIEQLRALVATLGDLGVRPSVSIQALLEGGSLAYTRDLTLGSIGDDVRKLQQFLIVRLVGPHAEALAEIGATGFFGTATEAALAEFQESVGITPAIGYFGSKTRSYILSHY